VTRIFDFLFSVVAIVVLLPFMVPIMIGLLLTGEHHIFYQQERIGKFGRPFKVLKFATMLKNSPNLAGGFVTLAQDPRILPMGKFLRNSKINELPQLVNILLGQMSFVGPRPIVAQHIALYSPEVQTAIAKFRPGLTGIGSLVMRDEEGVLDRAGGDRKLLHDQVIAPYKGQLELWYASHAGLSTYFLLIALTAWSLFKPRSRLCYSVFRSLPLPESELARLL